MPITLSTVRDQVEARLVDSGNLIYTTATLDEAIRAALAEMSSAYGSAQTLDDLDSATATSFDDVDLHTLCVGAVAFALRSRFFQKYEEASPDREDPDDLADAATRVMDEFLALLTHVRLRRFQEAVDHPYAVWDWDENEDSF